MSTEAANPFRTPPRLSSHPVDVGRRTEAAIAGELHRRGFEVLQPMTVNARYDLVVDFGDRFVRIQCKTGRLKDGAVRFPTASVRSNTKRSFRRSYVGEIDYFGVYCPELDRVYLVPVEAATQTMSMLRVEPPVNGQSKRIRWAADFELPPFAA